MALPNWQRTITTTTGDVVPGAEVEVVNETTGLTADLYTSRAGTSAKSNPFFADSTGFAEFYADPGEYRITATGAAGSQTWRYEVLTGTAATSDKTTTPTDNTADRLTKVGDSAALVSYSYPSAGLSTAKDALDSLNSGTYSNPLQSLDLSQDATGSAEGCWKFGSLTGSSKWYGGVLAPNGKIYGIPRDSNQVLEIDPVTQTTTLFGSLTGSSKWFGGVLAPNGKIYGIPYGSNQVLEIDPVTQTTTLFGSLTGSSKWYGGVLAPNGKIYGIPRDSTQVLEIDPVTQTTTLFGSLTGTNKWIGGVLAPNGKIYGIPRKSTQVLEISKGMSGGNYWALSAYTNKF